MPQHVPHHGGGGGGGRGEGGEVGEWYARAQHVPRHFRHNKFHTTGGGDGMPVVSGHNMFHTFGVTGCVSGNE